MGAISEYFDIKNEIGELKEEVGKKIRNSDETAQSRSESIHYLNKKIIAKRKRLKSAENRIIVHYVFPLFLLMLILAYWYLRPYFLQ
uniref:Uncharacterized protein n=1 Tax=Methanococcus maripaludis (strain C6 / ATCC BAA-1332) TaxID=444158 RepID=A9AAY0_METM6